ncbi:r [Scenedesmus sp. PABB004]|nr:r [Scenedesmus sp. PABB004] [Scenedesmus sp. PABB004]
MAPAPPAQAAGEPLAVMASGFAKLMGARSSGLDADQVSQVATRLVTFSMNLLVARQLTPEAYGLSAVQFHLIITTILFLSREGFRRGGLRVRDEAGGGKAGGGSASVAERVLRTTWLVLPIGAAVSAAVCGFVLWRSQDAEPEYRQAVLVHGVAALLELCVEPLYIISATRLEFGRRAAIETAALLAKCGLTLVLVSRTALHPARVFAAAQLAYAGVVAASYAAYGLTLAAAGELRVRSWRWDAADRATLRITRLFGIQAAEKLLLAEGSKLALVALESSYNQGVYGLVANLGSLAVRLLFTPVEEAAFTAFSRAGLGAAGAPGAAGRAALASTLGIAVRGVSLLGLLAVSFGPWYSWLALRLVYGPAWAATEAPFVLACYTCYLLALAVNGITEAFVHGVLDPAALAAANAALVGFSAAHVAASLALVRAGGAAGLVAADTLNMALRIAYSLWFTRRYFSGVPGFSVRGTLLPSARSLAACAAASAVLAGSHALLLPGARAAHGGAAFWRPVAAHVGVGVAVLAGLAAQLAVAEGGTARALVALRRQRSGSSGSGADGGGGGAPEKQE